MAFSIFEEGIPAIFWNLTYWVKFRLRIGSYDNFLEFLQEHQISFLAKNEIDFTNIPLSLHGKGISKNLMEYFANNTDNAILILNFLNYFITNIADFRYYNSGEKMNFDFSFDDFSTWQNTTFSAKNTTTTTTTIIITTTLAPTTTLSPLGFFEAFGQLYTL